MPPVTGLLLNSQHRFDINTTPGGVATLARLGAGLTSFEPGNNEQTDQSNYLDGNGYGTTTVTGAQLVLTFSGHRLFGDAAQDWIYGKQFELGTARNTDFTWTLPSGGKITGPCTIVALDGPGGDANAKGAISFEVHFNGKPTYTPPV